MRIRRHADGSLTLEQTKYAEEIVHTFGMKDAKRTSSLLNPRMKYHKACKGDETTRAFSHRYRQAAAGLFCLAGSTRPGLPFSAAYMNQFNEGPTEQHWSGLKHMLRYVKYIKDYALIFSKTERKVEAFCDPNWASNSADGRSFGGYVFTFAGAPASGSNKKQRSIALLTVEAEYVRHYQLSRLHLPDNRMQHYLAR